MQIVRQNILSSKCLNFNVPLKICCNRKVHNFFFLSFFTQFLQLRNFLNFFLLFKNDFFTLTTHDKFNFFLLIFSLSFLPLKFQLNFKFFPSLKNKKKSKKEPRTFRACDRLIISVQMRGKIFGLKIFFIF